MPPTTVTNQERRDISGLWVQGTDEKTDPALGDPATHGTFTRSIYLRLVHAATDDAAPPATGAKSGAGYQMLYVFNEAGELGRFAWQDDFAVSGALRGAWVSSNHWLTFHGDGKSLGGTELNLSIAPNLALRPPSDAAVPESFSDTGCPMAFGTATIDRKPTPVAGKTPHPSGNLNVGMPSEYITVHPNNPHHLRWCQRDAAGDDVIEIELLPADVMSRDANADPSQTWNDVFHTTYPEPSAVFVGYRPAEVDLYSGDMTGTHAEMWDNQQMSGQCIFEYPKRNSADYVKSPAGDGKVLPLGTVYVPITSGQDASSTVVIATENEHCESTALTLGLEGGVEGAEKASLSSTETTKTEHKVVQQLRYTKSIETFKHHALVRHLPNLTLEAGYVTDLYDLFSRLLSSSGDPSKLVLTAPTNPPAPGPIDGGWLSHEATYGSHYANAATFGHFKYLKTTLSQKTEVAFVEQSTELKAAASAAFDGFTGGPSVDVKSTWGDKFTNTIEHNDMENRYVGDQADPAPIFLDLRPANELLNPILLSWSAGPLATTEQIQAPFMWYLLRQSWLNYQRRTHQIDTLISSLPDEDWSPKIVRFHANANLTNSPEMSEGANEDEHQVYGKSVWKPYGTADLAAKRPGALVAGSNDYYRSAANSKTFDDGVIPGTEIYCTLLAESTTVAGAGVALEFNVYNWEPSWETDRHAQINLKMPMNGEPNEAITGASDDLEAGHVSVKLWREVIPPSA